MIDQTYYQTQPFMKWGPGCLPPETKVSSGPTQAICSLHYALKQLTDD